MLHAWRILIFMLELEGSVKKVYYCLLEYFLVKLFFAVSVNHLGPRGVGLLLKLCAFQMRVISEASFFSQTPSSQLCPIKNLNLFRSKDILT